MGGMRSGLIGAVLALGMASAAGAVDMSSFYGNTIVMKDPTGASSKLYINADKTYGVDVGGKIVAGGTWTDDGAQTCYTQLMPAPPAGTAPRCIPSVARKVGDAWTLTDPKGGVSSFTLVAGR
jgi:hypothetical protein